MPKRSYSAFADTDLDMTCRVQAIRRLVLVGQPADCCCRHTAYDAFRRGIEVTVVRDATCVYESAAPGAPEQRQRGALDYLRDFYAAEVVDTSTLLQR